VKHVDQIAQMKTLMARLDSGTNVDAGGFRQNPTSVYCDPELAARERDEFFVNHPQMIGVSGDLPDSNSFITVNELSVRILATRDGDGHFRAFVNACRHRGVVLEDEPRGSTRRFSCMFHNWTYDTGGALVGLPKQDHFGDIDMSCMGLVELPSAEKYGMLFVHPKVEGVIDVDALLGDELAEELRAWNLDEMQWVGGDAYDTACNWKLAMDTFGETYHFEILHKDTLAAGFHGNVQCYDTFGRNHRMILCKREIDQMRELPEDEWRIDVAGTPVYWLFPNVQLILGDRSLQLVRVYPDADDPGRHISQVSFYLRKSLLETQDDRSRDFMAHQGQRFGEVIRDEDYVASAKQQISANSGALPFVVFGHNEPALHHYHNTYRAALGMDLLPLREKLSL
jgi:phenylpropionate dioxygenase-like ring-hydroxylating dioxygenase large terminal subunit